MQQENELCAMIGMHLVWAALRSVESCVCNGPAGAQVLFHTNTAHDLSCERPLATVNSARTVIQEVGPASAVKEAHVVCCIRDVGKIVRATMVGLLLQGLASAFVCVVGNRKRPLKVIRWPGDWLAVPSTNDFRMLPDADW